MNDNFDNLDFVIKKYDNWNNPLGFRYFLLDNSELNNQEKEYFDSLMKIATEDNNWNDSDLILGCKITQTRLRKESKLSEDSIAIIVRAASCEWKSKIKK